MVSNWMYAFKVVIIAASTAKLIDTTKQPIHIKQIGGELWASITCSIVASEEMTFDNFLNQKTISMYKSFSEDECRLTGHLCWLADSNIQARSQPLESTDYGGCVTIKWGLSATTDLWIRMW